MQGYMQGACALAVNMGHVRHRMVDVGPFYVQCWNAENNVLSSRATIASEHGHAAHAVATPALAAHMEWEQAVHSVFKVRKGPADVHATELLDVFLQLPKLPELHSPLWLCQLPWPHRCV